MFGLNDGFGARYLDTTYCWISSSKRRIVLLTTRRPATGEAEAGDGAGSKAGLAVGSAPCNSLAGTLAQPSAVCPWELRRFDALRGVGRGTPVQTKKRPGA